MTIIKAMKAWIMKGDLWLKMKTTNQKYNKSEKCQYLNRIETDEKFTTGEVVLLFKLSSLKVVVAIDVTLKLKSLKVSRYLSFLPPHDLRHIALTKSVCTSVRSVSLFQNTGYDNRNTMPSLKDNF